MSASKLQLSDSGRLLHLLTLEDLPPKIIYSLFAAADKFAAHKPSPDARPLSGKLFVNIFFESSTRTRTAFEASARQLGADVVNLDRITMSGETKSETLRDTVLTIAAMGAAGIALRHGENGAAVQAAAAAPPNFAVINGGDGENAHPTQGLTDAYTLRERVGEDFSGLSIAIVGDVLHSRVARSDLHIFRTLGATDIRLVGPPSLCPQELQDELGATVINDMADGINGVDVVALLRVQRERLNADETGLSAAEYFTRFGLDEKRLAGLKPDVMVLHPGPINRGMEISNVVADGKNALILRQVKNGMAVRMAVLNELCGDR
ncbi:MAG: aspartate carbamoyltransferase catalytic subunit [Candidatus Zeuxoniibacter abyssi]|nr:MAG: aspartate carbamoyltransferase catalytic subunit [Candidatus Persebacteraceae bacterium AB1(2)]